MTNDEIMELAESVQLADNGLITNGDYTEELAKFFRLAYARGMLQSEKNYMQLFLDPENQPTQFGTATEEYREQEIAEVRDLLFALVHRIKTTHLYGMEVQKMLEQAEAIRARGQP